MPENKYPAPGSVANACYFLFCVAAVQITRTVLFAFFPVKDEALHISLPGLAFDLVHVAMVIVCAVAMFRGFNWARITFYVFAVLNVAHVIHGGGKIDLATGLAELVVPGGLLVLPRANRFFAGFNALRNTPKSKPRTMDEMQAPRQKPGRYDY